MSWWSNLRAVILFWSVRVERPGFVAFRCYVRGWDCQKKWETDSFHEDLINMDFLFCPFRGIDLDGGGIKV